MPKTCQNNLTLFAEDTPASHSPLPGSKEARKMTVTSGRKCSELSKTAPPLGSLLKMLLVTSDWASTLCFLTWKAQGTPHNRLLFRLVPSTPRIEETESGLLPTPSRSQCDHRPAQTYNPKSQSGRSLGCLAATGRLSLWATPNTMDYLPMRSEASQWKQQTKDRRNRTRPGNLREQVNPEYLKRWRQNFQAIKKMWPTPNTSDSKGTGPVGSKSCNRDVKRNWLRGVAKMWPTPVHHECRLGYQKRRNGKKGTQESLTTVVINESGGRSEVNGQLNPEFVEHIMGYPQNWTNLIDTSVCMEMQSYKDFFYADFLTVPPITEQSTGRVNRIKSLGNAVVPQIPELIGRHILKVYQ